MKNKIIYLVLITLTCVSSYSQASKKEVKGNKEYDKLAYIDAIKTYERIYAKGYKSPDMLLKIGNAYYFNAELEKANKWYDELYAANPDQEAEFFYRFAQTLRATKDYTKSDAMMAKFGEKSGNDARAQLFSKNRNYLDEIKNNSGRYKIENAGINSKYSDYGTAFMGTKVIFSSARDTGNFSKRIHTWTGQYFTNLYGSPIAEDGSLGAVDKFGKKINTKFHEDTPAFTKDGKTVYFTRNNYLDKRGFDAGKVTLLKIYTAKVDKDGTLHHFHSTVIAIRQLTLHYLQMKKRCTLLLTWKEAAVNLICIELKLVMMVASELRKILVTKSTLPEEKHIHL